MRFSAVLLGYLLILSVAGCTYSKPSRQLLDDAVKGTRHLVRGDPFLHLVYQRGNRDESGTVHVYLEGDGLPWITPSRIAKDPTPMNPLALRLMSRDPGPSLYLGRPCYHGLADSPGCTPWLWTHGRYSDTVVTSMAAALRVALGTETNRDVTLIGYSGGGVLAMLIAARIEQVRQVLTVAANLDTDAWSDHHGYSRLRGSVNPAARPPLPARIQQIHLAGGRDDRAPAELTRKAAVRQPNARFVVVPRFDHICCWEDAWPALLAAEANDFVPATIPPRPYPATVAEDL